MVLAKTRYILHSHKNLLTYHAITQSFNVQLYIEHCTLYVVHCTLYVEHTLYIICALYIVHCIFLSLLCNTSKILRARVARISVILGSRLQSFASRRKNVEDSRTRVFNLSQNLICPKMNIINFLIIIIGVI